MLTRINNDHGVTQDGKMWAISDQSQTVNGRRASLIYTVPVAGGAPKSLTEQGPSYFHGWSPDGKTLTYCAERNGNFDVYTISVDGGPEKRLTTAEGKDDGPEFSPDGQYIYFNSERSGETQIWRMKADGSEQEQVTQRRSGKLVSARLAERPPAGVPHLREGCRRSSGEQGSRAARDGSEDGEDRRAGDSSSAVRARSTCRHGRPTASTWRLSAIRWSASRIGELVNW